MIRLATVALVSLTLVAAKPPKAAKKRAPPAPLSQGESAVTQSPVELAARDEARKLAEAYLNALTGKGDDAARETLLGGATLNARLEVLSNWKIVGREPGQQETGEISDVIANIENLDKAGREALSTIMGGGPASDDPDGLEMQELDGAAAEQLLAPTKARAAAFIKSHPVFAYIARVDRSVYWHPKNPVRKLLTETGGKGRYVLDFHLFKVEETTGKRSRVWPLRVVRLRMDKFDTGWKILPASDWNAE